jgi:hypothetical protein
MSDGITRRIETVSPQSGYRVVVTWQDGQRTVADFSADVKRGGIWTALRDHAKFSQVRVAEQGAVLEWPDPAGADGSPRIDVDADGLYAMSLQQSAQPWVERFFHSIFERSRVT